MEAGDAADAPSLLPLDPWALVVMEVVDWRWSPLRLLCLSFAIGSSGMLKEGI